MLWTVNKVFFHSYHLDGLLWEHPAEVLLHFLDAVALAPVPLIEENQLVPLLRSEQDSTNSHDLKSNLILISL